MNVASPFWSISKCSQRMSPTKSGAKSRKRSFPIAHKLAPFMQNLSKSTFFRLNSFTVHVSHSATWFSVHCLGSEEDHNCYIHCFTVHIYTMCWILLLKLHDVYSDWGAYTKRALWAATHSVVCSVFTVRKLLSLVMPPTFTPPLW